MSMKYVSEFDLGTRSAVFGTLRTVKTLSNKFWPIEILLISGFTKPWSERDSGAEKSGSGLGGGEQCEHVPVRTGSAARGSEGAAAPNNQKKSRVGARITESARWNTKPPSAANSPSFKA